MKNILLILISFLCFTSLQAQEKFNKYFTNNGNDFGEGICQLPDSSYLITGSSSSFGEGPAQTFLLKINKTGAFQWSKSYGGSENDWGKRVFYVKNDGIYIAGFTNSEGAGSYDFQLTKTDETGAFLWSKTIGGTGMELLKDAIMLSDTSFVLLGSSTSTVNAQEDIFLVRMNKTGDTLWTKKSGGLGSDIGNALTKTSDTTFVLVGDYFDETSNLQQGIVQKYHNNGSLMNETFIGNTVSYGLTAVCFHENYVKMGGYQINQNSGFKDLYLALIYEDGTNLLERSETHPGDYYISALLPYGDSTKMYVSMQIVNPDLPTFINGEDILIHRYYTGLYWQGPSLFPSLIGQDQVNQFIPTSDGGAILVGFNSFYGAGGNNVLVVKIGPNDDFPVVVGLGFDSPLVGLNEVTEGVEVQIYPNPSSTFFQLKSPTAESKKVELFDAKGQLVYNGVMEKEGEIDVRDFKAGLYFLQLTSKNAKEVFKLVVNN